MEEEFTVFVRNTNDTTYTIEISPSTTIQEIKELTFKKSGI